MSLLLGMVMSLQARAEPFVPEDRPVDVEDLPELELKLDDAPGAEERLIRELLGIAEEGGLVASGEDVELEPEMLARFAEVAERLRDREAGEEAREQAEKDLAGMFEEQEMEVETVEGRWFLGVQLDAVEEGGLKVTHAMRGTPAAKAGLEAGDVLLSLNGIKLRDLPMLVEMLQLVRDQPVYLEVRRGEEKKKVKVVAERKENWQAWLEEEHQREAEERRKAKLKEVERRADRARIEELKRIREELRELMERVEKLER